MSDQPKEHGFPMTGPEVRAILENRKFQTRRLSKKWLKVKAGDLLWVRETWRPEYEADTGASGIRYQSDAHYEDGGMAASYLDGTDRWRPSIHMPRWASRITLEATEDARVERLQRISEKDCLSEGLIEMVAPWKGCSGIYAWAEGAEDDYCDPKCAFEDLWDSLHDKSGERFNDNPEVVVLTFQPKEHPRSKG